MLHSMLRLGISTRSYRELPMAEAARLIRDAGFEDVQVSLEFADARLDPAAPDWSYARRARDVFGGAGLRILAVDGYTNLCHPDAAVRERNVRGLAAVLEHAREFGTNIVVTEAGTFNPTARRRPQPADPVAGWKQFIGTVRDLAKTAESSGSILAMEPSVATFVGSVEAVGRMLDEVASPHLKILWDAANFFDETLIHRMQELLMRMYATFGAHVVGAHAKDVRLNAEGSVEWVAAGKGRLDYATFVGLLEATHRDIFLCLEYARVAEVPQVKSYVGRYL